MFTEEFEKTASIPGRIVRGTGSVVKSIFGKGSPTGHKLQQKGTKMVQNKNLKKVDKVTDIKKQKLKDRVDFMNKNRSAQGKKPIQWNEQRAKKKSAASALRDVQSTGSSSKGNSGKGDGFMGFIRRNPVASAVGAGAGGYMIAKPSNQNQYETHRPMIQ